MISCTQMYTLYGCTQMYTVYCCTQMYTLYYCTQMYTVCCCTQMYRVCCCTQMYTQYCCTQMYTLYCCTQMQCSHSGPFCRCRSVYRTFVNLYPKIRSGKVYKGLFFPFSTLETTYVSPHKFILDKCFIWQTSIVLKKRIFSCEAQLNTCTCPLSVCLSVRFKTEFLTVWSTYDNCWQLLTTVDKCWQVLTSVDNCWQLLTTVDNLGIAHRHCT